MKTARKMIHHLLRSALLPLSCWLGSASSSWAQSPPASFTANFTNGAQVVTVNFVLHPIRSANFSVLVQNAGGGFDPYTAPSASTYLGTVAGHPGAEACATLKASGVLLARVFFEDGTTWTTLAGTITGGSASLSGSPAWTRKWPGFTLGNGGAGSSVYAAEVGVDSSYTHFNRSALNVDDDLYIIEHSVLCANVLYLRDAGILHRIGRVVIRAQQSVDPYNGLTGGALLDETLNQWNNVLPASTHDLTAMISASSVGGGLAWVGVIGTSSRYSVNDSDNNGDFSVVWRHEAGHNWSANHYEGNAPEGPTIMSDNSLGRMSSPEASKVVSHRNTKLGILDNLGSYSVSLPPRASLDFGSAPVGGSVLFDVLANDHDANGNNLSIQSFDATSNLGGLVTRSVGTGPGGRDELVLQMGADHAQMDWFQYRIVDTAGRTATGIVYVQGENAATKLTGTGIGTPGSWCCGNTFSKALDGNLSTYYDADSVTGDWVGLDLGAGSNLAVTRVKFAPRSGMEGRMDGGQIQAANVADFSSGVVTLFTVSGAPASGLLTSQLVNNNTAYRYVRYLGPTNGSCNIAEIEFWGAAPAAPNAPGGVTAAGVSGTQVGLAWRTPAFATSYNVKRAPGSGGPFATIATGLTNTVYTDAGLVTGTTYYYVVSAVNSVGAGADSTVVNATPVTLTQFTGTTLGTPGTYCCGNTITNVFDANLSTAYDAANGSGDWAGLDLGPAKSVRLAKYAPRLGQAIRMVGGKFQGANVADFSSGVVTLGTIATTPPAGVFTSLALPNASAFRYVRYLGPDDGWCNVAEVQFWGVVPPPVTPHIAGSAVLPNGWFNVSGTGGVGQTYILLAAATLNAPIAWSPILTNAADSNGGFTFTDPTAPNFPRRFYRVTTP